MKTNILTNITCVTLLWAVTTGCSEETLLASGDDAGYISLNLDFDPNPLTGPRGDRSRATATEITKNDLTLTLTHSSGAIPPKIFTFEEFGASQRVNTGRYTLEASYGNADSEGWNAPYYYGSQQLTVKNETSTPVSLPVQLANAIVNITLSEGFTSYMTDYTVTVTTASGTDYVWANGETRQLYVKPGSVMVSVAFTKPNGKTATAQVDPFAAEARHRYNINVDIETGSTETLRLTFDDTITETKDVEVDISDANLPLLASAPEILADGFAAGATISTISGCSYDSPLKATIVARGKISTAMLNVTSAYLKKQGWPESIDLANPGASQSLLDSYGIKTRGLSGNMDVFAEVDFSGLISKLLYDNDIADNTSSFSLSVTDKQGKEKTVDLFSVNVEKLLLEILDGSEITTDCQATVKIRYNGEAVNDNVKLYARNDRGTIDQLTFTSTPGSQDGTYDLTINSPLVTLDASLTIYIESGNETSADYVLRVPSLRLIDTEINTFAKHVYATVRLTNEEAIAAKGNVRFEVSTDGGNSYTEVASTVDSSRSRALIGGTVTYHLTGLSSNTQYIFRAKLADETTGTASFTTEEEAQLPNSGMEDWYREPGESDNWFIDHPYTQGDSNPIWNTYNPVTTSQVSSGVNGYAYKGTSGTQYTTTAHSGQYAAIIRTVGWGSSNTASANAFNQWSFGTCKYISAGELFAGNWDGISPIYEAVPNYGVEFNSRPSSMSFYYKYEVTNRSGNDNGDYGTALIELVDNNGNIIASNNINLGISSDYTSKTISLNYAPNSVKASKIRVTFKSSGNKSALTANENYMKPPKPLNLSNEEYVGSKLYIDDIVLNY